MTTRGLAPLRRFEFDARYVPLKFLFAPPPLARLWRRRWTAVMTHDTHGLIRQRQRSVGM